MKNLFLRIIHGDIFTKAKLAEKGILDDDACDKCGLSENLEHLLFRCWYSARIWQRLIALYKKVDAQPTEYTLSTDFILASELIRPRVNLHLEIIRFIHQKDRPRLLPHTVIKISLISLITCTRIPNDKVYLQRLKNLLDQ